MHRAESGRVPVPSFCVVFHAVRMCYPPGIHVWQYGKSVANQEAPPCFDVRSYCWDFITEAWSMIAHMVELRSADSALPKAPSPSTRLVCLAWPALTLTLLGAAIPTLRFQGVSSHPKTVAVTGSTLKKDIPIRCDVDYLPEARARKGQISLWAKLNSLLHIRWPERDGKQI